MRLDWDTVKTLDKQYMRGQLASFDCCRAGGYVGEGEHFPASFAPYDNKPEERGGSGAVPRSTYPLAFFLSKRPTICRLTQRPPLHNISNQPLAAASNPATIAHLPNL